LLNKGSADTRDVDALLLRIGRVSTVVFARLLRIGRISAVVVARPRPDSRNAK
jgi:hypothetical protein